MCKRCGVGFTRRERESGERKEKKRGTEIEEEEEEWMKG